jgi:hypothetical protein
MGFISVTQGMFGARRRSVSARLDEERLEALDVQLVDVRTEPQIIPAALLWAPMPTRLIKQAGGIDWSTGRGDR